MTETYAVHPQYSRAERIADAVVHALGLVFGLAACIALAILVWPRRDAVLGLAVGLYGAGLLAMLACSALYNLVDHAAIFVMIAGTYTPFMLVAVGGAWGVALLGFVWSVAIAGVALKLFWPWRLERLSVAAYLLLGWSIVVVLDPLLGALSAAGLALLLAGGLLYSLGVVFHLWARLPYHNAIWHAFVLAAAVCHFIAIVSEVAVAG